MARAAIVLLCLTCFLFYSAACIGEDYLGCSNDASPLDNALKYKSKTGPLSTHVEWWTSYVYDNDNKIYMMLNNALAHVPVSKFLMFYPTFLINGKKYHTEDIHTFDPASFASSDKIGDSHVGDSHFELKKDIEGDFYHIHGSTMVLAEDVPEVEAAALATSKALRKSVDKKPIQRKVAVKWDFQMRRGLERVCICKNIKVSKLFNQKLNWNSEMPGAFVHGHVTVDGVVHRIKGFGEFEHLWGPVLLPTLSWSFAYGFLALPGGETDYSKNGGVFFINAAPGGRLRIQLPGGRVFNFLQNQFDVVEDKQVVEGAKYPVRTIVTTNAMAEHQFRVVFTVNSRSLADRYSSSENSVQFHITHGEKTYTFPGWAENGNKKRTLYKYLGKSLKDTITVDQLMGYGVSRSPVDPPGQAEFS